MPKYRDGITGDIQELDEITLEQAESLGYFADDSSSLTESELRGIQDPAWLERIRLEKIHGNTNWEFIKKSPTKSEAR